MVCAMRSADASTFAQGELGLDHSGGVPGAVRADCRAISSSGPCLCWRTDGTAGHNFLHGITHHTLVALGPGNPGDYRYWTAGGPVCIGGSCFWSVDRQGCPAGMDRLESRTSVW